MFVSSRNHYQGASAPTIVIGRLNQFYQSYPDVPVCQSVPYILCTFRVCHSCVSVCSNRQPSSACACRTTHTLYITLATRENIFRTAFVFFSFCPCRMAVSHGSLGSFDKNNEQWPMYCERVDLYLAANNIVNGDQRCAVLLSVCGPATYQLIRSLVAPGKPTDKTFDELVKLVTEHLTPQSSVVMKRFSFNARAQKENETIAVFVAELRLLAQHCEFGTSLEDMLRDRLVCGIKDSRLQRRLLTEAKLTFNKALEMAWRWRRLRIKGRKCSSRVARRTLQCWL